MSRPRTATKILDARGAFKKHPERKRQDPKCSSPFPVKAPGHLSPIQVKWWHKIKRAVPDGVLAGADIFAVELAAVLWSEFVVDPAGMSNGRLSQMRAALGCLGLSPADRAKLAAEPTKESGAFDGF